MDEGVERAGWILGLFLLGLVLVNQVLSILDLVMVQTRLRGLLT